MPRPGSLKSADELAQVGLTRHRQGELLQAERSYRAALARDPQHLGALSLLSTLLLARGDYAEAATLLAQAVALSPDQAMLHSNYGEALRRLDRKNEALAAFQRAVELEPDMAQLHYNLALVLDQMGQVGEALPAYATALRFEPELKGCALLYLAALRELGEHQRALEEYARLRRRIPESVPLLCCLGSIQLELFQVDAAIQSYEAALALDTKSAEAHAGLGLALSERGEGEAAVASLRRALELEPGSAIYRSNLCYLLQFSSEASPGDVLEAAREYGRQHVDAVPRLPLPERSPDLHRRLRVGYVSPDFRQHAIAGFMRPLLREHDSEHIEVFCYASVRTPDAVTTELRTLAVNWRDIVALDDDEAARLVLADDIDVLVDLAQHGAGHRLGLFARKPAPVQVSWLGYPGTTGVQAIGYRLTDPQLDPPELGDEHSSERLVRLPHSFWCYEPELELDVRDLPALRQGYVTFGSLNSFKKVSRAALSLWARVLCAVPASRLVLVAPAGTARERVLASMAEQGVASDRVELLSHMSRLEYFRTYQRIDVGLDTLPYGGGTTTLDSLWMGVPVVTLLGEQAVGRAGSSIAHNLGLESELVASSAARYVELATALATDLARLAGLRRGLRTRMQESPLINAPAFARGLEATYRELALNSGA